MYCYSAATLVTRTTLFEPCLSCKRFPSTENVRERPIGKIPRWSQFRSALYRTDRPTSVMNRCFSSTTAEPRFKSQLTLRYAENQMVRKIFFLEYFSVFTWEFWFHLWPIHVVQRAIVPNRHPIFGLWAEEPDCWLKP